MAATTLRIVDMTAGIDRDAIEVARVVQAAGTLPWRVKDGELQVQLIHRPRYNDWSWPKGRLNKGEPQPVGAIRETTEETGKPVALGVPLQGLQYLLADGRVKRVHYWAATRAPKKSPAVAARFPVPAVDPAEIDGHEWLSASAALGRLSRQGDQAPLLALIANHEAGLLQTRPLIIARHGKAIDRGTWGGDESSRPLTPFGSGQADAITQLLASFDIQQVVTSPWRRCAATIEPFAVASGITPIEVPDLSEHGHQRSVKAVKDVVRGLVAEGPGAVLCTHRPVLPSIFEVLRDAARPRIARSLPKATPYLQPGGCLVAHIADTPKGPRIVAFERFKPTLW